MDLSDRQPPDPSEILLNGEPATPEELAQLENFAQTFLETVNSVEYKTYGYYNPEKSVGVLFHTVVEEAEDADTFLASISINNEDLGEPFFSLTVDQDSRVVGAVLDPDVGNAGLALAIDTILQEEGLDEPEMKVLNHLQAITMATQFPDAMTIQFQNAFRDEEVDQKPLAEFLVAMVNGHDTLSTHVTEVLSDDGNINVILCEYEGAEVEDEIGDLPRLRITVTDPETNLVYNYAVDMDGEASLSVYELADEAAGETEDIDDIDDMFDMELEEAAEAAGMYMPGKVHVQAMIKILNQAWAEAHGVAVID